MIYYSYCYEIINYYRDGFYQNFRRLVAGLIPKFRPGERRFIIAGHSNNNDNFTIIIITIYFIVCTCSMNASDLHELKMFRVRLSEHNIINPSDCLIGDQRK